MGHSFRSLAPRLVPWFLSALFFVGFPSFTSPELCKSLGSQALRANEEAQEGEGEGEGEGKGEGKGRPTTDGSTEGSTTAPSEVTAALERAGDHRFELERALREVPYATRDGMEFLIANMPAPDLESLSADFLLENVALAYQVMDEVPWGAAIPRDIFLNDVLPYASVTESRDPWRRGFRERFLPIVSKCRTAAEAAHLLNQRVFSEVGVRYSTERRRADQSPRESMEIGLASCTGLSIILVDACRAVGVPARIAGTALWANLRGNHTWVEIWDDGDREWHFAGAAEPDPRGLDRGWFVHDASQAKRDERRHAIWASSWRRTGESFPLVFARRVDWVPAVNVTDRYAPPEKVDDPGRARLLIDVVSKPDGERVASTVEIVDAESPQAVLRGRSRDSSSDTNDILAFEVDPEKRYEVRILDGDQIIVRKEYRCEGPGEALLRVPLAPSSTELRPTNDTDTDKDGADRVEELPDAETGLPGGKSLTPSKGSSDSALVLPTSDRERLREAIRAYYKAPPEDRDQNAFPAAFDTLLAEHEKDVREIAWEEYRKSPVHESLEEDFRARKVRAGGHESPYTMKEIGERPEGGWALFIALHGGGGVPKAVNDQQWEVMQRYYRDQAGVPGYRYVALRAPTDDWNGFYTDYAYPIVAELVRQFLIFGDVDPDRVFLFGYSHGGYGAFAIAMTMPDRFAALHASAAAPTEGEGSVRNLRNTPFTYMVGERDLRYGRLERCRAFDARVAELCSGDAEKGEEAYPVVFEYREGYGHTGLPDREKIREMIPHVRNPIPQTLTWDVTSPEVRHHFWLEATGRDEGGSIEARIESTHRVVVRTSGVSGAILWLDSRVVSTGEPVTVVLNGSERIVDASPHLAALLESLAARGDPRLAFTARINL